MKKCLILLVGLLSLALYAPLTVSTAKASSFPYFFFNLPQSNCLGCTLVNYCWMCSSGSDGQYCMTFDCESCNATFSCSDGHGGTLGANIPDEQKDKTQNQTKQDPALTGEVFRLAQDTIREIAVVHPRFAATLANLNVYGFDPKFRDYHVHWTPVPISSDDIGAYLNRNANPRFFAKRNRKAREINKLIEQGLREAIIYDLTVEASDAVQVIKLALRNTPSTMTVDPPYTSLEITLPRSSESSAASGVEKGTKAIWRIN